MPRQSTPSAVATIGIDIGKNTFHLVGLDRVPRLACARVDAPVPIGLCSSGPPETSAGRRSIPARDRGRSSRPDYRNIGSGRCELPRAEARTWLSGISEVEINQLRQQFPQWIDGIQGACSTQT